MTWAEDGGSRRCARPPSSGPYGARIGAKTAAITNRAMKHSPTSAGLLRSRRRAAVDALTEGDRRGGHLGVPDPGVEHRVQDIHQKIHHEEDEREDQDRVL